MMYVLGDSYSFGWNFFAENRSDRKELLYSNHLAKKLNVEYKNLSLFGSSNYRIARLVNLLHLTTNDIVIIGWSGVDRIELGIPKDQIFPNDIVIDFDKIDEIEKYNLNSDQGFQIIEKTNNLYTRAVYPRIVTHSGKIINSSFRKFVELYYNHVSSFEYQQEMYKILFHSTLNKLRLSGCKFRMFSTFDGLLPNKEFLNIPEYLFYKSNMLDEVRYKDKKYKSVQHKDFTKYWTADEHVKIADILFESLR